MEPASNEDGSLLGAADAWLTNAEELRGRLATAGHRFRTDADAEVAVHLYEQEGLGGLSRLKGSFALCIWDKPRRTLLLARDRLGERPLFFAALPGGVAFASELQALRAAGLPLRIDEDGIRLYFVLHFIPEPNTAFEAAKKVKQGGWVLCDTSGAITAGEHWRLPAPVEQAVDDLGPLDDVCARIRTTFDEAVRARIRDQRPAAVLSGGLDSSSVVASMSLQGQPPVAAYTVRYEEEEFDETKYAAQLADKYGSDHEIITVRPESVLLAERAVRHLGEPNGDTSAVPTLIMAREIASRADVVLTGDGGDEMFGGYESYADIAKHKMLDRIPLLRRFLALGGELLPYRTYGKNYLRMIGSRDGFGRFFAQIEVPYHLRRRLLQLPWLPPADLAYQAGGLLADYLLQEPSSPLSRAVFFTTRANFSNGMLPFVDRMTRAYSVEALHPFLDTSFVELAWSLPLEWKIRPGHLKWIWRKAMGDRLPAALLEKQKTGFAYPLGVWFRTSLREFLRDHLTSRGFLNRGFVSPRFLRYLIEEHERGRRDNNRILWSLLILELWLRDIGEPA
jgi:asparagine synthase (glutamine-hydrolysing)